MQGSVVINVLVIVGVTDVVCSFSIQRHDTELRNKMKSLTKTIQCKSKNCLTDLPLELCLCIVQYGIGLAI